MGVNRESHRAVHVARRLAKTAIWSLPFLLPLGPAAISLVLAAPESSKPSDVEWAATAIPPIAFLGAWARAAQSLAAGQARSKAWLSALAAASIGVVMAYLLWWQAVVDTCHGGYECPF